MVRLLQKMFRQFRVQKADYVVGVTVLFADEAEYTTDDIDTIELTMPDGSRQLVITVRGVDHVQSTD